MSDDTELQAKCLQIQRNYSPCDVSDTLLNLHVPSAGVLADISPIPPRPGKTNRLVAPVSTVLFVPKDHQPGDAILDLLIPEQSNLPSDTHFTDAASPGSVVLMQQPRGQISALLGDIVATRYKVRGIKGVIADGRTRDITGINEVCKDGNFQAWSTGLTSVGTSCEAKPWAVDVPLKIGRVVVKPGDIVVMDEAEMVCCVIPREKLDDVMELLPKQKEADDGLLRDVQQGMGFREAIQRWPEHYTVRHAKE